MPEGSVAENVQVFLETLWVDCVCPLTCEKHLGLPTASTMP